MQYLPNSAHGLIVSKLLSAYRAKHPASRAPGLIKLFRNGSKVKQYGCTLCGAEGPTFAAMWPETKKSVDWCIQHTNSHVDKALMRHRAKHAGEECVAVEIFVIALASLGSRAV
jgi:hypothetical protein